VAWGGAVRGTTPHPAPPRTTRVSHRITPRPPPPSPPLQLPNAIATMLGRIFKYCVVLPILVHVLNLAYIHLLRAPTDIGGLYCTPYVNKAGERGM
jgi:hypothetical protein